MNESPNTKSGALDRLEGAQPRPLRRDSGEGDARMKSAVLRVAARLDSENLEDDLAEELHA